MDVSGNFHDKDSYFFSEMKKDRVATLLETPGNFRSSWKLLESPGFWKKITNSPGNLLEFSDFNVSKICFGKVLLLIRYSLLFLCPHNFSPIVSTNMSLLVLAKKIEMSKWKYKVIFVDHWLEIDRFERWLQKVEKETYSAKCSICCKTFGISNMVESTLTSHMKGKKHCELAPSVLDPKAVILVKVRMQIY